MPPAKKRFFRVLALVGLLAAAGLGYAWVCRRFGVGIGCPVYQVTGLQCPGCGVSRMCLCLLRLDFAGAWQANPVVLCLLPAFLYLGAALAVRYIRTGSGKLKKPEEILVYAMIGLLLLFGIVRNLQCGKPV